MRTNDWRVLPGATYRLQLHEGCTLDHASEIVGYLADLGVSHVYCSPILQAAPHSTHGYDGVDPAKISAELGGRPAFDRLAIATAARGMGIVLDIVPNHLAVNVGGNAPWWDVLERGKSSRYAGWFDIDWDAPASPGQVFLPVLGADLDVVLAAGELAIETRAGAPVLCYFDARFPLAAGTAAGRVEDVVRRQHYRLASWREAAALNYRRFFDVTSLAGLRVEDEEVFDATHRLLLSLVAAGQVDGLRVDHPDGLADPQGYFDRLQRRAPGTWVVAEKILEPGESLDERWPVAGTSGYDALCDVNNVFIDPAGRDALVALFADLTGALIPWSDAVYQGKLAVIDDLFHAEFDWLSRVASRSGLGETRAALRALVACFPVYRSYLRGAESPRKEDLAAIETARAEAVARRPELGAAIAAIVNAILSSVTESSATESSATELRTRFQQTTGPVMAKGVEDTAFYRYHRLVSLNEVGGDPGRFGGTAAEFHAACSARQADWPHSMTTLSTHDTKRSEDVRARISLLAQCADEWAAVVRRWVAVNERHWPVEPDRGIEYLLYQSIVGAWPLSVDRACWYAEKASREAKERTSWIDPDPEYDAALQAFVAALYDDRFVADLAAFVRPLVWPGRVASMAQKLVQLTMPGVPDSYQGTELWDLSLVDPDNRRPVDFQARRRFLAELADLSIPDVLARVEDGLPKLLVVQRALALRRRLPAAFSPGSYQPLLCRGPAGDSVLAFGRGQATVTVVPRFALSAPLPDAQVTLPAGRWHNEFTGAAASGQVEVAALLAEFPVALLSRQ